MPQMTGVFRARKGMNGNEVGYLPIPNAAIQFVNVATNKQQMVVDTDKDGKYSFNMPVGRYTVGAYIKGAAPVFNTISGGAVWEVFANSPSNSFDQFVINPNSGEVDGALLEKFKRLADQSTQGAIESQKSAELSLANSQTSLNMIDTSVWKERATYLQGPISCLSMTHAVMLTKLSDGPLAPTAFVYIRRLKYSDNRYLLFVEEYPTASPRGWVTSVTDGVLGEWQPNGATKMKENGFWDKSALMSSSDDLFTIPRNGWWYLMNANPAESHLYPTGRALAFVQIQTHSGGGQNYCSVDWTEATGASPEKYRISRVLGKWLPPRQYAMHQFGNQSFSAWRAADLPTRMTGWYAMNGDNVLLNSRVGQNLNSLPQTYKDDWGIKVTGANISLPNWFHADGRGYHPRASLVLGAKIEDAVQNIWGYLNAYDYGPSSPSGAFSASGTGGTYTPQPPGGPMVHKAFDFNVSRVIRTATETRGMSIGLLPIIYLGV